MPPGDNPIAVNKYINYVVHVDDLTANSCDNRKMNLKETDVDGLYLLRGIKKKTSAFSLFRNMNQGKPFINSGTMMSSGTYEHNLVWCPDFDIPKNKS